MIFKIDLQFEHMMTPLIIKVLYGIGIVSITAGAVFSVAKMTALQGLALGIGLMTVGQLVWRLLCEEAMLLYRICEHLQQIDRRVESSGILRF